MTSVKPRQIIKVLESKGFKFVRQKGSHRLYRRGFELLNRLDILVKE